MEASTEGTETTNETGNTNSQEEVKPEEGNLLDKETESNETVEGAPESYEEFKLPDGMPLTDNMKGKFNTLAKDLNLSQDKAQSVMNLAVEHLEEIQKNDTEAFESLRDGWIKELEADKDFGGDKFDENVTGAIAALDKFGSPELKEFLISTGYGDNPELMKFLANVNKATREEEELVEGKAMDGTEVSRAKRIYPNMQ